MTAVTSEDRKRRVTDAPTRMFHWMFALCFSGAYLTSESERFQIIHAGFGYTIVSLLIFRIFYGWLGPRSVRWASVMTKLKSGWIGCNTLHLGSFRRVIFKTLDNFVRVLTTSSLLILSVPLLWSGHVLYVSSSSWLEEVHGFAANTMLLGVLVHLFLLLGGSVARGTNLAAPMLHGKVPGSGPDLVSASRLWLAIALMLTSCAFGFWTVGGLLGA